MASHHPVFDNFRFSEATPEKGWRINGLGVRERALYTSDELVNAATALRQISAIPFSLVAVEAEPTHFAWIKTHFQDNGLDPNQHQVIQAAAASTAGKMWFCAGKPSEWYGQSVADPPSRARAILRALKLEPLARNYTQGLKFKKVRTITLSEILAGVKKADLIDIDIQGAELSVVESSKKMLSAKAKRVHIGTHSREIEDELRTLFSSLGWKNIHDYSCHRTNDTPFGAIPFCGGIQTWLNPRVDSP